MTRAVAGLRPERPSTSTHAARERLVVPLPRWRCTEAARHELEAIVHKEGLEDRRGMLSPATMQVIDLALRHVLALR